MLPLTKPNFFTKVGILPERSAFRCEADTGDPRDMNKISEDTPVSALEAEFCCAPADCADPDVVIIGAGIGLAFAKLLWRRMSVMMGRPVRIVVVDSGPLDLLTHVAHTNFPRWPIIKASTERVGGKLCLWGVSAPRPPLSSLVTWPYDPEDLAYRFASMEEELGVSEPTPMNDRALVARLETILKGSFPDHGIRPAPLAINSQGRRWSPIDDVP